MNVQLFSDAMNEINEKYIIEAVNFDFEKSNKKIITIGAFRMSRQVAVALLIVVLFVTTACSVKAFREAISEFFIGIGESFYDFYIEYEYDEHDTIEQRYCFVTYPEGFEEISDEVSETCTILELQNVEGDTIVLSQVCGTGGLAVDSEQGEIEIFDVNGIEVMLYTKDINHVAYWINDSYWFTFAYYGETDTQTIQELIKMIEPVEK